MFYVKTTPGYSEATMAGFAGRAVVLFVGMMSEVVSAPERHSHCPECGYEIHRISYGRSPYYQSVWHWCTRCMWTGREGLFLIAEPFRVTQEQVDEAEAEMKALYAKAEAGAERYSRLLDRLLDQYARGEEG